MIMLSSSINFWMGISFEFVQFYQSENLFMDIYTLYNNKEMDSKYRIKCSNKWSVYDFKKKQ